MFHQWYSATLERQKEIEAMVKRQRVPEEWEHATPGMFRRVLLVVQECVARRAVRPKQPHASHRFPRSMDSQTVPAPDVETSY